MPRFCRICSLYRRNALFSGDDASSFVCRECWRLVATDVRIIWEKEELHQFLNKLNISNKRSFRRLRFLSRSSEPEIAQLAKLVLDIAKAKPHKKKRIKFLARNRRDLIDRMVEIGLLEPLVSGKYDPTEIYDDETDDWSDILIWNPNWVGPCEEYDFVSFDAFYSDESSFLYLEPEAGSDEEECLYSEAQPPAPEAGDSYFTYQFSDPHENLPSEEQELEDIWTTLVSYGE